MEKLIETEEQQNAPAPHVPAAEPAESDEATPAAPVRRTTWATLARNTTVSERLLSDANFVPLPVDQQFNIPWVQNAASRSSDRDLVVRAR